MAPMQMQPCCCGISHCSGCCHDARKNEVVADIGSLGWSSGGGCSWCGSAGGEYSIPLNASRGLPKDCDWFYIEDTGCTSAQGGCADGKEMFFAIAVSLVNKGDGTCQLRCRLAMGFVPNEACASEPFHALYAVTITKGGTCAGEHTLSLFDYEDDLGVTNVVGDHPLCTGLAWPSTITVTL